MKVILTFLITLSGFTTCKAQGLKVEISGNSVLYQHARNNLSFLSDSVPCHKIKVYTSQGVLSQDSCNISIVPENIGQLTLSFYIPNENDSSVWITKNYRVKDIPRPKANLFGKTGGNLSAGLIKKAGKLHATNLETHLTGCGIHTPVINYRVLALRGDSLIGTAFNEGDIYQTQTIEILEKLQAGDNIYFLDIYALSVDKKQTELEAIKFEVN